MMGIPDEGRGQQAKITPNHFNLDVVVTIERRGNSVFWSGGIIMEKCKNGKQRNNSLLDMSSFRYLKGSIKGKHIRMQKFFLKIFFNCVGVHAYECMRVLLELLRGKM